MLAPPPPSFPLSHRPPLFCTARLAGRLHRAQTTASAARCLHVCHVQVYVGCRTPSPSLLSPVALSALGFKRPLMPSSPPFLTRHHCPPKDLLVTRSHFPAAVSQPSSTEERLSSANSAGAPPPPPLLGESHHHTSWVSFLQIELPLTSPSLSHRAVGASLATSSMLSAGNPFAAGHHPQPTIALLLSCAVAATTLPNECPARHRCLRWRPHRASVNGKPSVSAVIALGSCAALVVGMG
jgi:hypothetical protein